MALRGLGWTRRSRVVFMHQGHVHEIGPPGEVFANPRTPELQQFLGVTH